MAGSADANIPATMKAWVYDSVKGGIENTLKLVPDYPLPPTFRKLPKDSILVRILAASANPVDHKLPELPVVGGLVVKRPAIPCADFSGRVIAATAPGFEPGQLVAGKTDDLQHGSLAEYAVATPKNCVVVPEGISPEQAASVSIAGTTAWLMLTPYIKPLLAAKQASGSPASSPLRVFVNGGSGGVGTFAIQIAKSFGCHVTTTCSAANADFVRQLGADEVIDYRAVSVPATLASKVAPSEAGGSGQPLFDLALDTVGAPFAYYKAADTYLAPHGTYVQVAVTALSDLLRINLLPAFLGGGKRKTTFVFSGSNAAGTRQVLDLIAAGKVQEPVEVLPFAEAPSVFTRLKTHRTRGKLIVQVAEDK